MAEFSIRSDGLDVEQIMRQIRARIRAKRGADYTEEEIRRLADAKLETFLDSSRVRSELLDAFRRARTQEPPSPNFAFEDHTIFETHRPVLRALRRLLRPILKLFFNPNPIAEALHIQAQVNARTAERLARMETLYYELIHNLVVETTRLGIDVKSMKMRLESIASRLDFDERRARALEGAVQYRPGALQARALGERRQEPGRSEADREGVQGEREAAEHRKRRRRRGRRRQGPGSTMDTPANAPSPQSVTSSPNALNAAGPAGEAPGHVAPAEGGPERPERDPDTP